MPGQVIRLLRVPLPVVPGPSALSSPLEVSKYLHALVRAIEENLRDLYKWSSATAPGRGADAYLATVSVSSSRGTGWYQATLVRFDADGGEVSAGTGEVLCATDYVESDEYINTKKELLCHRIVASTEDKPLYVALETFGRATIGIVP